jgi:hypothetical protein
MITSSVFYNFCRVFIKHPVLHTTTRPLVGV